MVQIEGAQFISICGKGDPNDKPFSDNIEALYSTAYTLKFIYKAIEKDFVVSKLEGLWWFDEAKYTEKDMVTTTVEFQEANGNIDCLLDFPTRYCTRTFEKAKETAIVQKGYSTCETYWISWNDRR